MTIQQNGGFKSSGDGPKEKAPPAPVTFRVKYTYWPHNGDCSPEETEILVEAMSYDGAIAEAEKALRASKTWSRVIALYSVEFVCNRWGQALKPHPGRGYATLQFVPDDTRRFGY